MPTIDPKTLRFMALLSAPLFVMLRSRLGIDITPEVQEMLIGTVALYILGSHGKEAIIARAELAAEAARAKVVPGPAADAVVDAAAKGTP